MSGVSSDEAAELGGGAVPPQRSSLTGSALGAPTDGSASGAADATQVVADSDQPLVCVRGLSKSFSHAGRKLEVLKDINLDIDAGEMLAVVGMSGVGKSTLLHILGTLDRPTTGQLWLAGRDLSKLNATQLAAFRNRTIGFVFQFHHLLPEFDALENTMMPALIHRVPRATAHKRAAELLDAVGLSERMTHRPGQLSGGEQQRVALARALVMRPRLLLADEPTGNLDSKTSESTHELFVTLNRQLGTTLLVVTHNPSLADRMPRRLVMADGRLNEASVTPANDLRAT